MIFDRLRCPLKNGSQHKSLSALGFRLGGAAFYGRRQRGDE
jgi:hypothetical protein